MKNTLQEIQERVPGEYIDWPLCFKQMLTSMMDYYMAHDQGKFLEAWAMLKRWSEAERHSISFNLTAENGDGRTRGGDPIC